MNIINKLLSKHRNGRANQNLGGVLAFVAGFINAGGFFIVQQYTSHMTGIISIAADDIALGKYTTSLLMLGFIASFVLGAAFTTILVIKARKKHLHSQYALPLLLEAFLIAFIIGLYQLSDEIFIIPTIIALLCFLMGLQNALITKASTAIIRTTHITGMTTDLGIEIGRILCSNTKSNFGYNQNKAFLHIAIISTFFVGGVIGAIAVANIGALGLLPISFLLIFIASPPLLRDLHFCIMLRKRYMRNS